MKIHKKWWFWIITLIILISLIFILAYVFKNYEKSDENKCTDKGCDKCYNRCIPWELAIKVDCPAPTEEFRCECIDNKCVKVNN